MNVILMSLIAGALGMGLGSTVTAVLGKKTDSLISVLLAFAAGVMLSIVFIELIPEAYEHSNMAVAVVGVALGALLVIVLNKIVDKISEVGKVKLLFHGKFTEAAADGDISLHNKKGMLRSGIIILIAITLHNIPEGLAMGAAGQHDISLGMRLAIMIALHNIPEGMAVAAPLIAGGLSKGLTAFLSIAAGATTTIGAIIGMYIGGINELTLAFSFSIAGGAMLYIVFAEVLPQSIAASKGRGPAMFALIGAVVGLIITAI